MVIRENLNEGKDDLAITKAAAWAWYERGSWFEHKSIRESDCRRTSNYTRRPSRYKLEAMKNPQNETHEVHPRTNGSLSTKHFGNSLFDMYEIERISRDLDCYFESGGVKPRPKSVDGGGHGGIVSLPQDTIGKRVSKSKSKSKSKSEKSKGFWTGRPLVCAANRDDVVNSSLPIRGRRQQKEHVMVDGVINFRRPITHGSLR